MSPRLFHIWASCFTHKPDEEVVKVDRNEGFFTFLLDDSLLEVFDPKSGNSF